MHFRKRTQYQYLHGCLPVVVTHALVIRNERASEMKAVLNARPPLVVCCAPICRRCIKDWERRLRPPIDHRPNRSILASGSATALKSTEWGAGCFTDFLLPPLTFSEFPSLGTDQPGIREASPGTDTLSCIERLDALFRSRGCAAALLTSRGDGIPFRRACGVRSLAGLRCSDRGRGERCVNDAVTMAVGVRRLGRAPAPVAMAFNVVTGKQPLLERLE